jgi:hypothetical protein
VGLSRIDAFDEVHSTSNRALQLEKIRSLAPAFKANFKQAGPVQAVRTLPVARSPYPVNFAFNLACTLPYPYLLFHNRALLIQFKQRGVVRHLLLNPTLPEVSETAPFYKHVLSMMGPLDRFRDLLVRPSASLPNQLRALGIGPEQIDYVAFDHQHVQGIRPYVGTPDQPGMFPKAHFLLQRADWESSQQTHPLQRWWWVDRSAEGVNADRIILLNGDYQLGDGVALIHTPGHTWGNQSLLFHSPQSGCYTVSENGISMDNYSPRHSRIPGLAVHANRTGEEVILNGNTREGSLEQYNSMVQERLLADPYREDPNFVQHFASSELVHSAIAPGLKPTHAIRYVDEGQLLTERSANTSGNGRSSAPSPASA